MHEPLLSCSDIHELVHRLADNLAQTGFDVKHRDFYMTRTSRHGRHRDTKTYLKNSQSIPQNKATGLQPAIHRNYVATKGKSQIRFNCVDGRISLFYKDQHASTKVDECELRPGLLGLDSNIDRLLDTADEMHKSNLKSVIFRPVLFSTDKYDIANKRVINTSQLRSAAVAGVVTIGEGGRVHDVQDGPQADAWFLVKCVTGNCASIAIVTDGAKWMETKRNKITKNEYRFNATDQNIVKTAIGEYVNFRETAK